MFTQSGIDPQAVANMVNEIANLKKIMIRNLEEVNGHVMRDIERNYSGHAADALKANIRTQVPVIEDFLERLISNLIANIGDDLEDTQRTDDNLAG
ncbi:MAG: hypothetical protein IJG68_07000 [Bacilli bacterium]|nr:hypothetical protein [Bacilli bacterium]